MRPSHHNTNATADIRSIVDRWMKLWQGEDILDIDRLHAPDFIDHSSAGRRSDNEGFKKGLTELYQAFPDFFATTDDVIIDERNGKAVIRWSAVGTHRGEFVGVPPTGRKIRFNGIEIITIKDGLITARWGEWDGLQIMEQLGLILSQDG